MFGGVVSTAGGRGLAKKQKKCLEDATTKSAQVAWN